MGTTYYYEGGLTIAGKDGKAEKGCEPIKVGVFVSSFSGDHELYIRLNEDEDKTVILTKKKAKELLEGLNSAMQYLGYE